MTFALIPVVAMKHYAQVREHEFMLAMDGEEEKSAAMLANKKESPNLDDSLISLLCRVLQSHAPQYAVVKVRSNGSYKTRTIVKLFEKFMSFQKRAAKCDAHLKLKRKSFLKNNLRLNWRHHLLRLTQSQHVRSCRVTSSSGNNPLAFPQTRETEPRGKLTTNSPRIISRSNIPF